jgi:hypothetical protein
MSITIKNMSNSLPVSPIASTLKADPLAGDILRFLLENERAMDSTKGIAAWWVHTDELAVQSALQHLVACGAILAHTLSSGTTLYRLTQDLEIRAWLRRALGGPPQRRRGNGRHGRATQPEPSVTDVSNV